MELTNDQITEIEKYLSSKDVTYLDIRYEILDHIATDVTEVMLEEKLSFSEAWIIVQEKWHTSFVSKSSWLLGFANSRPAIVIDKSLRIYKPLFFKSILLLIALTFFSTSILDNFIPSLYPYKEPIEFTIGIGLFLYSAFLLFWWISMRMKKIKTSYSFLFYKQILPNIIFTVFINPLLFSGFFNKENEFNNPTLLILYMVILSAIGGRYFYKKHIEIIKNYKMMLK